MGIPIISYEAAERTKDKIEALGVDADSFFMDYIFAENPLYGGFIKETVESLIEIVGDGDEVVALRRMAIVAYLLFDNQIKIDEGE